MRALSGRRLGAAGIAALSGITSDQQTCGLAAGVIDPSECACGCVAAMADQGGCAGEEEVAGNQLRALFPEVVLHGQGFHMLHRIADGGNANTGNALKTFISWLMQMGQASAYDPNKIYSADSST